MEIFTTDDFESNLKHKDQVWCTPILPTFRRVRQGSEFQASYIVSLRPVKVTKGRSCYKPINNNNNNLSLSLSLPFLL